MYRMVMETPESTVLAAYDAEARGAAAYQSEAALETAFLRLLTEEGYEYAEIHDERALRANLRVQIGRLNGLHFSDGEWRRLCDEYLCPRTDGIAEKTEKFQRAPMHNLVLDNGDKRNIYLFDRRDVHRNFLQVIHQYGETGGNYANRYDVTVLVNGLPIVQIELKRRGVRLEEAFRQIARYQRDSFWAGDGLYQYVQLFVISNGTETKYYSNSTREDAVRMESGKRAAQQTAPGFDFTSYWADARNRRIADLMDFGKTFFARHTLLSILARYCVFTADRKLMVMRPYQIAAAERILQRIVTATNYKKYGTIEGGGYIWHTTGSGKTLTSFKTAQLAAELPDVDKVIFVVDRKDLDYQTMKEYDSFEKGAANGSRNTAVLTRQLEDRNERGVYQDYRILVTTIQKLDQFIKKHPKHPVYDRHVVLIFDECHRSQFGDMHQRITKHFRKYHIFGFTGTPIFAANAGHGNPKFRTTAQAFGDQLHAYTIVDAIHDENVLPFHIDYVNTVRRKEGAPDAEVEAIDTEAALLAPQRISGVVRYILDHFAQKTKRSKSYVYRVLTNVEETAKNARAKEQKEARRLFGFNSIFAVSSIEAAQQYYREFQQQMAERPAGERLRIATIYSYGANDDDPEAGFLADENSDNTEGMTQPARDFLESAIGDYNGMFGTSYDTSADKFPNYYRDVSLRMKNREVDLLIVVNMFLTGFDAKTLNTLWVDKNLRQHGLIQAFSRTNRILNAVKACGNIVCFRDLSEETDAAIALFGDREAHGAVLMRPFADYYYGFTDEKGKKHKGYEACVTELLEKYPLGGLADLESEKAKKAFIMAFGAYLRLRNILTAFDEFAGREILSDGERQDYQSYYLDLQREFARHPDRDDINDDVVFEMELVRQVEVNIDYILMLVEQYHEKQCRDKTILAAIQRAVRSSPSLRSKKELIDRFLAQVNTATDVPRDWEAFVRTSAKKELDVLVAEEHLRPEETARFVRNTFRDGELRTGGTAIDGILPKMSRFGKAGAARQDKKQTVIGRLRDFFDRYFGLGVFETEEEEETAPLLAAEESAPYGGEQPMQ